MKKTYIGNTVLKIFQISAHVEAAVRVIGCVCDMNGSWTLDWEEINGEDCLELQEWMFDGEHMDEQGFQYVDANDDGEIDGDEAASALEQYFDYMYASG